MKRNYNLLLNALLPAVLLTSCYKDNKEDLYQNMEEPTCNTDEVTYSGTVKGIMESSCALSGCHAGASPQSGLDFSNFSTVQTAANDGRIMGRITGSEGPIMPPGGTLPQCEIDQVQAWIDAGASNN